MNKLTTWLLGLLEVFKVYDPLVSIQKDLEKVEAKCKSIVNSDSEAVSQQQEIMGRKRQELHVAEDSYLATLKEAQERKESLDSVVNNITLSKIAL